MIKWDTYKSKFIIQAKSNNKSEDYIQSCLQYAKTLFDKKMPIIYNQEHFCLLVGFNQEYIHSMSNSPLHFYRHFEIPKSNGKLREIDEPLPDLKEIQRWILIEILNNIPISPYAKAYVHDRSIKENARFHKNQNIVLNVDIKDFFPSISVYKVISLFKSIGYNTNVSVLLANLCCLNNSLPQGAPTSPAISNIVCNNIDFKLSEFAKINKLRYTRYADDITMSGNFIPKYIINHISTFLLSEGFTLNKDKTRALRRSNRQEVTGIVVNKKLQAPRDMRRKLKQDIFFIKKYGIDSHLEHISESRKNYVLHLIGIANFILFINPKDDRVREYLDFLKKL